MRQLLILIMFALGINVEAQNVEEVDSVDVPQVAQIPFEDLDSMTMSSLDARYVVVYKAGRCGVYDMLKEENVTEIRYKDLWFSYRREMEGEHYTYFGFDEEDAKGIIGIVEATNQFLTISMPKKEG